jgi:sensor histidine kinase YesM
MNSQIDPFAAPSIPGSVKKHGRAELLVRMLWVVPGVALFILGLFLSIGRTSLSESVMEFADILVYSTLIGLPSAIVCNWIGHRFSGRSPQLIALLYTMALVCTAIVGTLAGALVLEWMGIVPHGHYWREFRGSWMFSVIITLMLGLSFSVFETLRGRLRNATLELRTRQVEQERANKLLVEARLSSLESRIHPHFLFNTLNSISSLIPTDPKRAEDTVGKLASLLRFSISANQNSLVPLSQELKIVRDYLDIESTRFGQRLRYDIAVPESLGDLKVPPLALQTLVENSVKHVVARRSEPASIKVEGAKRDGRLDLAVIDDGPGFSLAEIAPDHGLGNLVGRLQLLFGESAQLSVKRLDNRTVVTIRIPAGASR